jgi:hypothetical protein
MNPFRVVLPVLMICALVFGGCEQQPPEVTDVGQASAVKASVDAEPIALEVVALTGWELEGEAATGSTQSLAKVQNGNHISGFERQPLGKNIVHYKFQIRTGPGAHDRIGIHRVVKEANPCRPNKMKDAIFLLHGDAKDFEGMFLLGTRSDNTSDDFGLAIYLAENNVDVWGIDQAWTLVPTGLSNFDFMREWGLQRNVDDLLSAMAVARASRLLTGNGFDRMILLGYSSGGATGYAALNHETQLSLGRRQIRGFVSADMLLKANDPAMRQSFVNDEALYRVPYDNGTSQADIPFQLIGQLARTSPDAESPIFGGMTNIQVALYFGSGQIFGSDVTTHYLAGILDNTGFPIGLQLITIPQWLDFLEAGVPYEPNKFIIDYDRMVAGIGDSPFDDHVGEIRVPIFNLGAKGGLGPYTMYGTTLLGSSDITHLLVALGTGNTLTEFGHIDLFAAPQAPQKVWQPILKWLKAHRD